MKILHCHWISDGPHIGFHFWAENADLFNLDEPSTGSFHPFSSPQLEVLDVLRKVTDTQEQWGLETLTLNLPSTNWGPMPSSSLPLNVDYPDLDNVFMKEWRVRTVVLSPLLAWRYLLAMSQLSLPKIGWAPSVQYWVTVLEFVLELLARECFLPQADFETMRSNEISAGWVPYFPFDDYRRMKALAEAMPAVCRSAMSLPEAHREDSQALSLHAIQVLLDSFIRTQLTDESPLMYRVTAAKRNVQLHESWLRGLFAQRKEVKCSSKDSETFSLNIKRWLAPLEMDYDSPFRVCFRLSPPEKADDPEESWLLTYYLQSHRDLSVIVSAKKIWQKSFDYEGIFAENEQELIKFVHQNMKKAALHFKLIEKFIEDEKVPLLEMNTEDAYHFLREVVPVLEDCGFGVMLPSWWKKPLKKFGVRLQVAQVANEGKVQKYMGLETIVKYDWKVALGEEELSLEEFQRLAELKMPLVNVRGEWVELKVDEIEKAIAFFQKRAKKMSMTLGDVMSLALEEEIAECGMPVVGIDHIDESNGIFKMLFEPHSVEVIDKPAGFMGDLRPYQSLGLSWLVFLQKMGLGACLADDMGLGKTIQLIALFVYEREVTEGEVGPTLIMCPMSIMGNWEKEIKRFSPNIKVLIHHGVNRLGHEEFAKVVSTFDVVITTYALAAPELEKLSEVPWHRIVLDEAQNIKNNHTKQTQAIKKLKGTHRVALTGTPLENRLLELWSIMDFINPNYLGAAKTFRQKYAIPIERFNDQDKSNRLKRLIRPFVLRRVKTDRNVIKDLPEKIETKEMCYLSKEQVSLYESVVKKMLTSIDKYDGIQRRGIVLSVLMQLKQICNHPVQYLKDEGILTGRSGKMARLYELLEEVTAEGDRALIFTQFSQMGHLLKRDLQDTLKQEVLFLHGMTTKTQRDEMIERFQDPESNVKLFVLSLKAGGLGLNLTAANHVFHFDRWWNPAIENQATDRAFRIGQQKTVQVHKFVCQGTVEERIDEMIDRKRELTDLVVEQGEDWITELSTNDLRDLFKLNIAETT